MNHELREFLNAHLNYDERKETWTARSGRNWLLIVGQEGWCIFEEDYSMYLELSGPPSVEGVRKVMELVRFAKESR